jgi:hypothetical protein
MKSPWPTKKLGDKEYFEILGSGIEKFEGEKEYLSTSSIEGNKIIAPECKITFQKRPSRANMQPRLNSVWFARMINTIKVYSFTEANKDEIDKYILSTGFAGILCNPEKVNPRYLEKIFLSKWFNDLKDSLASDKAIQKSLNNDDIANLEIPIPPLPIQQKIVKILDTIQEAIDIHDKIIEKTKELKKSLMVELFKYGASSFRKGRKLKKTEIGEIPEDWEVVRLREVHNSKVTLINPKDFPNEEFEYYSIPAFHEKGSPLRIYGKEIGSSKILVKPGIILFGKLNPKLPKVWLTGDFYKGLRKIATTEFLPLIPSEKIIPLFSFYLMYSFFVLPVAQASVDGSTTSRQRVNSDGFYNIKIPLPPLPEQQEIAEILQTVDQKIEIEKRKKELYEELFKTMLNKIMNQEIDIKLLNY